MTARRPWGPARPTTFSRAGSAQSSTMCKPSPALTPAAPSVAPTSPKTRGAAPSFRWRRTDVGKKLQRMGARPQEFLREAVERMGVVTTAEVRDVRQALAERQVEILQTLEDERVGTGLGTQHLTMVVNAEARATDILISLLGLEARPYVEAMATVDITNADGRLKAKQLALAAIAAGEINASSAKVMLEIVKSLDEESPDPYHGRGKQIQELVAADDDEES